MTETLQNNQGEFQKRIHQHTLVGIGPTRTTTLSNNDTYNMTFEWPDNTIDLMKLLDEVCKEFPKCDDTCENYLQMLYKGCRDCQRKNEWFLKWFGNREIEEVK